MSASPIEKLFCLQGRVAIITGGAGLLGSQHAAAVIACGGIPVLIDINAESLHYARENLYEEFGSRVDVLKCDITDLGMVQQSLLSVLALHGRVDILINNAARNPKAETKIDSDFSRLELFSSDQWDLDLAVGLKGAFHCTKVFGAHMARSGRGGVILNIASDLAVIAPDQRLYAVEGLPHEQQPVKPITYSVVKHGLVGLTKYVATYWCDQGIRCNSLSPGGVYADHDGEFVRKITQLIPLGRMAQKDEYRGAIAFLCSDASSYMNGANIVLDGGRSIW